ncbi:tetratricopeptide repeat protein [Actinoplanes sp. G11-F43]|uniref:tetratricopeptide repeat protein n=1 Tax=Actinoplanes sp. G11-F43 TaxID=3424130 RepID=UPI003D32F21A
MKTAQELWDLLGEADHLPYGSAQIAVVEQVLRHVDSTDDAALRFYARLFATTSYIYGGEPVKAFPTFSWCVSDFDRNPSQYHQHWTHNLLWLFKNMVSSLTTFPEVPLERTRAVLDDMERRYREAGHGLQPVFKHRYLIARHVGDREAAEEWFSKWQAAPRDSLSDCAGCDPTTLVRHLAAAERFEEAAELAGPVLAGDLSCSEQPQTILGELMTVYLKTGRRQDAADAHRRSYLLERNNLADLWEIGGHIRFCARTGNESRGLEILQRHIDWLERAPSPAAAMHFAAGAVVLLRRLTARGHGDTLIRRADRPDVTASVLAAELEKFALEVAARFDARNGTDHQSGVIVDVMNSAPFEVELPLAATARRAAAPVPAPRVEPEAVPVDESATADELLDLVERCQDEDRDEAARTVLAAFESRFGVPEDQPRYWSARGFLLPDDRFAETVAAWERAADLFDAAGDAGEASMMRARIAVLRARDVEPTEELLAVVRANAAHHDEHGDAKSRASAWLRLSQMFRLLGRPEEANDAGDRSDRFAAEVGDPRRQAYHAMVRAHHRALDDRGDEALAAAREAWAFYREHGPVQRSAEVATMVGQLSQDAEEVVAAFGETIAAGLEGPALGARLNRGRGLMVLGRPVEAVDEFAEAIAILSGLDDGDETGIFARQDLAQAYYQADRPAEAAEVAEEALLGFERLGHESAAADTRFLLAAVYRDLGDTDRALGIYRTLIEGLADNPAGRGQVGEQAGQLLYDLDRDAEAALTFRAAAESLHESGDLAGELRVLRRRLMALNYADDMPQAEEVIRLGLGRFEELPDDLAEQPGVRWSRSIFAFEIGNLYLRRERYADALPYLAGAPERLREIGADEEADRMECMVAEALLRSGSVMEAERVLSPLVKRLGPDSPARELAVNLHNEAINGLNDR